MIITDEIKIDIAAYANIGWKDRFWYQRVNLTLAKIFKSDDLAIVCELLAATSINSTLKSNVTLFRRAWYEYKNQLPVGSYVPVMRKQILSIRSGGSLSGKKNFKLCTCYER